MNQIERIVVGTAQFGMSYGINNPNGKVPENEVFDILNYALNNNIREIDTSYLYGDSESTLGKYNKLNEFDIVTKCPSIDNNIDTFFSQSLERLNKKKVDGYLIHHFDFFIKNTNIWSKLQKLKESNKISKIGFSLYYPSEFEFLIKNDIYPDIIQIPYNIFDQRFEYIINNEKYKSIKFYTRSAFLQGLFFIEPEKLKENLISIKNKLIVLNKIAKNYEKSISELCLKFVLYNTNITKTIIGVDNLNHLKTIIEELDDKVLELELYESLKKLKEDNENIILPFNWNK